MDAASALTKMKQRNQHPWKNLQKLRFNIPSGFSEYSSRCPRAFLHKEFSPIHPLMIYTFRYSFFIPFEQAETEEIFLVCVQGNTLSACQSPCLNKLTQIFDADVQRLVMLWYTFKPLYIAIHTTSSTKTIFLVIRSLFYVTVEAHRIVRIECISCIIDRSASMPSRRFTIVTS